MQPLKEQVTWNIGVGFVCLVGELNMPISRPSKVLKDQEVGSMALGYAKQRLKTCVAAVIT